MKEILRKINVASSFDDNDGYTMETFGDDEGYTLEGMFHWFFQKARGLNLGWNDR